MVAGKGFGVWGEWLSALLGPEGIGLALNVGVPYLGGSNEACLPVRVGVFGSYHGVVGLVHAERLR